MKILSREAITELLGYIKLEDSFYKELKKVSKKQAIVSIEEVVGLLDGEMAKLNNRIKELNLLREPLILKMDKERWSIEEDQFMCSSIHELIYSEKMVEKLGEIRQGIKGLLLKEVK